MRTAIKKTQN